MIILFTLGSGKFESREVEVLISKKGVKVEVVFAIYCRKIVIIIIANTSTVFTMC